MPVEHVDSHWTIVALMETRVQSYTVLKRMADIAWQSWLAIFLVLFPLNHFATLDHPQHLLLSGAYRAEWAHFPHLQIPVNGRRRQKVRPLQPAGRPQVTRMGRLMRKTRLDELPQLMNILRGDMSLIGPRPERPEHVHRLTQKIPFYRTRLVVRPGLTGWAQVRYGYGSDDEDALIKLQYDLYYIRHQTFLLDMNILVRTIGRVLRMSGI
jgi:lipopolysaccharide/colanic/teichoic acid biosynthesis glycosyltransferase